MKIIVNTPSYKDIDKSEIVVEIKDITTGNISSLNIHSEELSQFSSIANKQAVDFFFISSFVYGIDRFIERKVYSTDGWSREFEVTFPVYDIEKWEKVKVVLNELLSFLTGDYWKVNFIQNEFVIEEKTLLEKYSNQEYKQVNLFSGGLDSLIGAIDFLSLNENTNDKLILVSHNDSQMRSNKEQSDVYEELEKEYPNMIERVLPFGVTLSETSYTEREKTFRSRSLLFLGIAVLIADFKKLPIIIPENGSVSLNYPLSASRRGACSTRTTHPTFIEMVNVLLNKLELTSQISNPYEFNTKGEMVDRCQNKAFLKRIISKSNSCGKKGHVVNRTFVNSTHCGVCMPCTYRKASLINLHDNTPYGDDLNKEYSGKKQTTPFLLSKQGQDINAMLDFLGKTLSKEDIKQELLVGGIKDFSKLDRYIDLVVRTRNELRNLVDKTCYLKERKLKAGI